MSVEERVCAGLACYAKVAFYGVFIALDLFASITLRLRHPMQVELFQKRLVLLQ